jgi:uncharacterized membrane protein YgcG
VVAPAIIAAVIIAAGMVVSSLPYFMQIIEAPQLLQQAEELQKKQAEASQQMVTSMVATMVSMMPFMMMMTMMQSMMSSMTSMFTRPAYARQGVY